MTHARRRLAAALFALAISAVVVAPGASAEATRPSLDDATTYAVVADQAISSSGATAITGNVAVAGTTDLAGFPPGTIDGETHLADAEAVDVAGDTTAVNQDLKDQPCNSDRSGEDLGGLRLGAAVYCYITSANLDGELRLDALGDIDAVWVFQIGDALEVTAGSDVLLVNGAQSCNVFWQIDGQVTVAAGASLAGTFVSDESIVLGDGASLDGRLFTPQGTVQLAANTISQSACAVGTDATTTTTTTGETTTTTAEASTTTTAPAADVGSGTDSTDGTGSGSGEGDTGGLALTGPTSVLLAATALAALAVGHALLGTERVVAWNARRWRPRHAQPRFARVRSRR